MLYLIQHFLKIVAKAKVNKVIKKLFLHLTQKV